MTFEIKITPEGTPAPGKGYDFLITKDGAPYYDSSAGYRSAEAAISVAQSIVHAATGDVHKPQPLARAAAAVVAALNGRVHSNPALHTLFALEDAVRANAHGAIDPLSLRLMRAAEGVQEIVRAYLEDYEQGLEDGTYDKENRENFTAYEAAQAELNAAINAAQCMPVGGSYFEVLREASAVISGLEDQIGQMRGMFDDEDNAIQNALDDAEAFAPALKAAIETAEAVPVPPLDNHAARLLKSLRAVLPYVDEYRQIKEVDANSEGGDDSDQDMADEIEADEDEAHAACQAAERAAEPTGNDAFYTGYAVIYDYEDDTGERHEEFYEAFSSPADAERMFRSTFPLDAARVMENPRLVGIMGPIDRLKDWPGGAINPSVDPLFENIPVRTMWTGEDQVPCSLEVKFDRAGSLLNIITPKLDGAADDSDAGGVTLERRGDGWWVGLYVDRGDPQRAFLIQDGGQIIERDV